jgi:hypothetical protein
MNRIFGVQASSLGKKHSNQSPGFIFLPKTNDRRRVTLLARLRRIRLAAAGEFYDWSLRLRTTFSGQKQRRQ